MNSHFKTFLSISPILVPIISAILGYICGRGHQLFLEKRSIANRQFHELYLPFEKLYFKKISGAFLYTDLPDDLKTAFFDLLIDSYELGDSKLQRLIKELKWILEYDGSEDKEINDKFFEICVHLDGEYNKLAKRLYYPVVKF